MTRYPFLLIAALVASLSQPVRAHVTEFVDHAHEPGVTDTAIALAKGQVRLLYTVPRADLARATGASTPDDTLVFVAAGFTLRNVEAECPVTDIGVVDYSAIAAWQYELAFSCEEPLDFLRLHYGLFPDEPGHRNYTEIILGAHVLQIVLGDERRFVDVPVAHLAWERGEDWALPDDLPAFDGRMPTVSRYFVEGIDHVLTGYDHLAFVMGLVLVLASFVQLAWTITAFTLAHTLTVGIAAAGIFVPSAEIIEPLIAITIVYIGIENLVELWLRYRGRIDGRALFRRRWPAALLFGLAHGFGFAYMLRELGLPEGEFLFSLILFNLGVEAGQLAVVILPFLLVFLLRKRAPLYFAVAVPGSVFILLLGAWWLFERIGTAA